MDQPKMLDMQTALNVGVQPKKKYYHPVGNVYCPICFRTVKEGNADKHLQSKGHIDNARLFECFRQTYLGPQHPTPQLQNLN